MKVIINPNGFSYELSAIDILKEALKGTTNEENLARKLSSTK